MIKKSKQQADQHSRDSQTNMAQIETTALQTQVNLSRAEGAQARSTDIDPIKLVEFITNYPQW